MATPTPDPGPAPNPIPTGDDPGELVPPIMDYTPEEPTEPGPDRDQPPTTPPSTDGSSIIGVVTYPAPGEG